MSVAIASSGCSTLKNDSSIVRVSTKQNSAKANRLTYAGIRALNLGNVDLAAKRFREAVKADMAYGPAHNNLGLMHYDQGNLYQAVTAFEQAREYLPNDPTVVYNLGLALESAGRTEEALDLYYTANQMDRANPHFLGNLVRLRLRLGEHDELLETQLKDLALIETRPDWRRWADKQLALTINWSLDRGPETPDLESTANESLRNASDVRDKIIDLTPVVPASLEEEAEPVDGELSLKEPLVEEEAPRSAIGPMLEEGFVEDLSEEANHRE